MGGSIEEVRGEAEEGKKGRGKRKEGKRGRREPQLGANGTYQNAFLTRSRKEREEV
jgi:hypothetical protein